MERQRRKETRDTSCVAKRRDRGKRNAASYHNNSNAAASFRTNQQTNKQCSLLPFSFSIHHSNPRTLRSVSLLLAIPFSFFLLMLSRIWILIFPLTTRLLRFWIFFYSFVDLLFLFNLFHLNFWNIFRIFILFIEVCVCKCVGFEHFLHVCERIYMLSLRIFRNEEN